MRREPHPADMRMRSDPQPWMCPDPHSWVCPDPHPAGVQQGSPGRQPWEKRASNPVMNHQRSDPEGVGQYSPGRPGKAKAACTTHSGWTSGPAVAPRACRPGLSCRTPSGSFRVEPAEIPRACNETQLWAHDSFRREAPAGNSPARQRGVRPEAGKRPEGPAHPVCFRERCAVPSALTSAFTLIPA